MGRELRGLRYFNEKNPDHHDLAKIITDKLPYWDFEETIAWYDKAVPAADWRGVALLNCNDRYYLLTSTLGRQDLLHPWLFDRCREVEAQPDGHIDLWARGHGKSSIITTGGIIQEILCDPEITIAIFSVTKPIAVEFLAQIKNEFEVNELLKSTHSDILFENPRSRTDPGGYPSKWGLARGITVRREQRPKEATVEAHGLIDGQPTGRHFKMHVYDDVVTQDYLADEQLKKTTARFEMADNLGTRDGVRKWIAGTRYHFADAYGVIIEKGSAIPRIYAATYDGSLYGQRVDKEGRPVNNLVLLSQEDWERKKRDQGMKTISAQMLLNPLAGNEATFSPLWLTQYEVIPRTLNVYILVDPSKGSGPRSDRTAIAVIGIDPANNRYLLDGFCHRMKLSEREERVLALKSRWENFPGVMDLKVGWEQYGAQVDIEAMNQFLREREQTFPIEELNTPRQGGHSKKDRIERLEPDIRGGRFKLPASVYHPELNPIRVGRDGSVPAYPGECYWTVWTDEHRKAQERAGVKSTYHVGQIIYRPVMGLTKMQRGFEAQGRNRIVQPLKRSNENMEGYDLTRIFIEEMVRHPFAPHDDLIDACSRIFDIDAYPPKQIDTRQTEGIEVNDEGIDPGSFDSADS